MTTLRDIVAGVDFSNSRMKAYVDSTEFGELFGLDIYQDLDDRLVGYYINPHYCTDTWVGTVAYFLDREFVAISTRIGRKYDPDYKFVSLEASHKVKEYLLQFVLRNDPTIDIIADLDTPQSEYYQIEFSSQILHKSAIYKGEIVRILNKNSPYNYYKDDYVDIELPDSTQIRVKCLDLFFPYNSID